MDRASSISAITIWRRSPRLERDSRRFTDPSRDEPFFARRRTGGSIGGPIKKDSLFWFFNMEHNNQDGVFAINNGRHPIFSQFDVVSPNPLTATQANLRIDMPKLSSKNSAFIRLSNDHNDNFNPANGVFLPSNWVASKNVAAQGLVGLTAVFTPKLVNDFRFSYGFYSNKLKIPTAEDCRDPIACIGLGGIQIRTTLSDFRIGNNLNTPQNRVLRTYQFSDNVSYQKGEHRIRFGASGSITTVWVIGPIWSRELWFFGIRCTWPRSRRRCLTRCLRH